MRKTVSILVSAALVWLAPGLEFYRVCAKGFARSGGWTRVELGKNNPARIVHPGSFFSGRNFNGRVFPGQNPAAFSGQPFAAADFEGSDFPRQTPRSLLPQQVPATLTGSGILGSPASSGENRLPLLGRLWKAFGPQGRIAPGLAGAAFSDADRRRMDKKLGGLFENRGISKESPAVTGEPEGALGTLGTSEASSVAPSAVASRRNSPLSHSSKGASHPGVPIIEEQSVPVAPEGSFENFFFRGWIPKAALAGLVLTLILSQGGSQFGGLEALSLSAVAFGMARGSGGAGYKRGKEKVRVREFPLKKIFSILRPYWKILLAAALLMTLDAGVLMALPQLFREMVGLLKGEIGVSAIYTWLSGLGISLDALGGDPWKASLLLVIGVSTITLGILAILNTAVSYLMTYIGSIQMRDLSVRLYQHVLRLPLNIFQKHRSGELTSVIDTNLYDLRLGATDLVTNTLKQLIMVGFTTYFLTQIHFEFAMYSAAIFAIPLGIMAHVFRRARSVVYDNFYDVKRNLTGAAQEAANNIRIVKGFAQEDAEVDRYAQIAGDAFMDKGMKIGGVTAKQFGVDTVLTYAALFAVAGLGFYYIRLGELTVSAFMSLILYAYFYKDAFSSLSRTYSALGDAQGAARLVFDLWNRPTEEYNADKPDMPPVRGDIEFQNVHFAYTKPAEKAGDPDELVNGEVVIKNFDLKVPAGTSVAFVGKSGSGKTTLTDLLMKLMQPTEMVSIWLEGKAEPVVIPRLSLRSYEERIDRQNKKLPAEGRPPLWIARIEEHGAGRILVDGRDIRDVNLDSFRRQFAVVPQEPYVKSGTVLENILYGEPDATEEEVERAVKLAHAYDFIRELDHAGKDFKKGLQTVLGERGVRLSTGQKQRLMIARAFLRDPRILIMDEPTSALDAESEGAVVEAMEKLMEGRTTIVVAHRLSTIQQADKVVFLKAGRVLEQGTIPELLAQGGEFARYWKMQELTEQAEKLKE